MAGDTIEDAGPLPDGRNFSDAEIAFFYDIEGSHVQRGAAAALEALAAAWSAYEGRYREGPVDEESLSSTAFANQAQKLRAVYGHNKAGDADAAAAAGGFSVAMRRSSANG